MSRLPWIGVLAMAACGPTPPPQEEPEPSPPDTGPFFAPDVDCGVGVEPGSDDDLIRWPYVQSVTTNSAVIAWGGPMNERDGYLHYGADNAYGMTVDGLVKAVEGSGGQQFALHWAELTDLEAGTEYCYKVQVGDKDLAGRLSFRTAPESPYAPVKFFAFGDYGSGTESQLAIRDQMLERQADIDLWFTTGDNAYGAGSYMDFHNNVFQPYQEMWAKIPVFPTPGNHDYMADYAQPYLDNFFLPENAWREEHKERYYSIDWGPIHYVALDSEQPMFQLDGPDDIVHWLDADLARTDRPWKIVAWHRPPYEGHPTRAPDPATWYNIVPLMEKHGVQLVLLGHNHYYERMVPILSNARATYKAGAVTYVITGGGGRTLYDIIPWELQEIGIKDYNFMIGDVSYCELSMEAYNGEGQLIDSFTIPRCF